MQQPVSRNCQVCMLPVTVATSVEVFTPATDKTGECAVVHMGSCEDCWDVLMRHWRNSE